MANLPLNGRNVYDLIQLAPGAVNVRGVVSENGANTVVNGLREDFNGFLINGSSNKGLSGGAVNQPIEDTVQEFQELTLNMSAQYGNSAGSVTNLITKSGTNQYHGSGWYFGRNDFFDANYFFANQTGTPRQALRYNQFGGTFGGAHRQGQAFLLPVLPGQPLHRVFTAEHGHGRVPRVPASRHCWPAEFGGRAAVQELRANLRRDTMRLIWKPTMAAMRRGIHSLGISLPGQPNALIAGRMAAIIGVTAEDQAQWPPPVAVPSLASTPVPLLAPGCRSNSTPSRSTVRRIRTTAAPETYTTAGKPRTFRLQLSAEGSAVCAICLEPLDG